jgi:hypothetical protein
VSIAKRIRWLVFVPAATTATVLATASAWSLDAVAPAQGRAAPSTRAALVSREVQIARLPKPTVTPANGKALGGFTSQRWPVVLDVATNGRSIAPIGVGLDMTCTSGNGFGLSDGFFQVSIGPHGSVRAASTLPPMQGSTVSITGGSDVLTGRLNRSRATFTGTWELHVDFQNSDGTTDHCDSGRVSLTAKL